MDELIAGMRVPENYPHVIVYYPPHAKFETYDLIVVAYAAKGQEPSMCGYQLKEGRKLPKESAAVETSFVVRGDPSKDTKLLRGWTTGGEEDLLTGAYLAPKQWRGA